MLTNNLKYFDNLFKDLDTLIRLRMLQLAVAEMIERRRAIQERLWL